MYRVVVFVSTLTFALSAHLPSSFQTCKASDFTCLNEKMENAVSLLANGNKELGIPKIDPFIYDSLTLERKPGPISLAQKYSNVSLSGISKSTISMFQLDLNACKLSFEAMIPNLQISAHYVLNGQLLIFPIDAEGDLFVEQDKMVTSNEATCEKFEKDGDEYIRIVDFKVIFHFGKLKFKMGEIVKGNDQINDDIHKVINDDPLAFVETLKPSLEQIWDDTLKEISNKVFTQIPLKEIFKE